MALNNKMRKFYDACEILNIGEIELHQAITHLYEWQCFKGDSFSVILYSLFKKADPVNRAKLNKTFPAHSFALELWNNYGDAGNDLFREWGLME